MRVVSAVEVGRQDFDRRAGRLADGQDATPEVLRAAVGEVVAGDGRDDDVSQAEPRAGFGEAFGFVVRDGLRMSALHRAEAARAGADVAEHHERRRAAGPALRAVGAAAALADRFKPSSPIRSCVKYMPPAAGIGRFSQAGSRRGGRAATATPQGPEATSLASTSVKMGKPGRLASSESGGVDMSEDFPADQGMLRVEVVPFEAETATRHGG